MQNLMHLSITVLSGNMHCLKPKSVDRCAPPPMQALPDFKPVFPSILVR